MRFIDIAINCPDHATADEIAEVLVSERLAACANIIPGVSSVYRWQGRIERAEEVTLLLKTRVSLFDAINARVLDLHPYDVPSIIAVELVALDKHYAEWLAAETLES